MHTNEELIALLDPHNTTAPPETLSDQNEYHSALNILLSGLEYDAV